MAIGVLFALAAGLMWGLVFVAPLLLPQYSAAVLSVGRYLAFGLIALPLAWLDRKRLRDLSRADWIEAAKLSAVGNFLYYVFLAAAHRSCRDIHTALRVGESATNFAEGVAQCSSSDNGADGHRVASRQRDMGVRSNTVRLGRFRSG